MPPDLRKRGFAAIQPGAARRRLTAHRGRCYSMCDARPTGPRKDAGEEAGRTEDIMSYTLTQYKAAAYEFDEHYNWDETGGEGWDVGTYATLDDAREAAAETLRGSGYRITRTRHGLDTVIYEVCEVYDDEAEEVVDVVSSLPDEVRAAMERHQRDYWSFLDYEAESYGCLVDYLEQ